MNTISQKWKIILSVILVVILMTGCSRGTPMEPRYSYAHPTEDIVSIELLANNNIDAFASDIDAFILIRKLDDNEVDDFMVEIYKMQTSYCISPPLRGYGRYVAKVTYSNGDVEMLGTEHIEYIQYGDVPTGVGAYYFTGDAIDKLILQYGYLGGTG